MSDSDWQTPVSFAARICVCCLLCVVCAGAFAASPFNSKSGMGINLAPLNYYSSEQPFINSFVTSSGWVTHSDSVWDTHEEQYVDLDKNGWPVTLKAVTQQATQQFTSLGVLFLVDMPDSARGRYPSGEYIVLYDGEGTLSYGNDATLVRRSPGRDVVNVSPSNRGIDLRITATDPRHTGNYVRNIKVVTAANEAATKAGQIFDPTFLALIKNFRALRFMDWFQTNGSTLAAWGDRPLSTDAFFGTPKGVPIETALQLSNAVSADAWLNVPAMADDDFVRKMAILVHGQWGGTQKVYVELSNEVWNSSFGQFKYAAQQGKALWPTRSSRNEDYDFNRQWFGMRTAQMCDIWRSVWGADARLVCVLGAQAAWPPSATDALKCPYWTQGAPCAGHAIDAVAIAPYFGGALPPAWTAQPDGGLASLFQSLYSQNDPTIPKGGFIAENGARAKDYVSKLVPYKLPLLAYEGGQSFANGATEALDNLYMAANRDPRMARAYIQYLQLWKASGGELFMQFDDIGAESKYGSWGALESQMQKTSPLNEAPPKWQAIQIFVTGNPCWWRGCSATIDPATAPDQSGPQSPPVH